MTVYNLMKMKHKFLKKKLKIPAIYHKNWV